jgi:hypothetical protein
MIFEDICRQYFPRWRTAHLWEVREGPRGQWVDAQGETRYTTEAGWCDRENRVIWRSRPDNGTLIHEICHAVRSDYHGKRFLTRLRQAAQQAEKLGDSALATALFKDADDCATGPKPTAPVIYCTVEDLIDSRPERSYEEILDYLAEEFGSTPDELSQRYRRLRHVYDKAKRESS